MQLVAKLRDDIRRVRDGYATTPADRKRLYLFLKANGRNGSGWKAGSMRHKVGTNGYDWLVGLEKYGDEHGWLDEHVKKEAIRHGRS